jgi:EmrB/QacA subfamily drug resistance transporter
MVASDSGKRIVQAIVACCWFMHGLDGTIVATALPQIAASLHVSPVRLSVVITAYMVSLAVFIPMSAWLADRFGAKVVFGIAVAVFTLSSILCGLSNGLETLTIARALQGAGGAMLMPIGRLVLLRSVPKSGFVQAMSLVLMAAQVGPVLGPPVGGFITTFFSWRWIFLINAPIGLIGFVTAMRFIDDDRDTDARPFDWTGFILNGLSLSLIVWGIQTIGRGDSDIITAFVCISAGFVLGVLSIVHAQRTPHALLKISLFKIVTFRVNSTGGTFSRMGNASVNFLLPLLFQVVFGMSALASGLLTFANAIGSVSSRAMVPEVLRRFGFRSVLIVNGVVGAANVALCAFFSRSTPLPLIFAAIFIGGASRAIQFTCLNTLAYADVEGADMSGATSLAQLSQQLGQVLGIAIASVILQLSMEWRDVLHLQRVDLQIGFLAITGLTLFSVPYFVALLPHAGEELSGHRRLPSA